MKFTPLALRRDDSLQSTAKHVPRGEAVGVVGVVVSERVDVMCRQQQRRRRYSTPRLNSGSLLRFEEKKGPLGLLFPNDLSANVVNPCFRLPLEEAKKKGLWTNCLECPRCLRVFVSSRYRSTSVHHASALLLLLLPVVVPGVDYSTPPRNTSSLLLLFLVGLRFLYRTKRSDPWALDATTR